MQFSMSSELYENDSFSCPREEMRQVLRQKAHDLFLLCDQENKGFASKRDMYRLKNELPLTPEQLDEVFDVLDKDKNGCLTLEEFTEGLGMFLGIDSYIMKEEKDANSVRAEAEKVREDDEKFEDFLDNLGAHNVFKDEDYIRNMWEKVKKDDPVMLRNLENFLEKITQELKSTEHDYSSLETTLRNRSNIHEEQVQVLYTEMEEQLETEKKILLAKERSKEQKIRDELETELNLKDQQLQDFMSKHAEMERRLRELNTDDSEKKHENVKLEKERDSLELQLAASEKMLKDMQTHLEVLRKKNLQERRKRAKAALKVSEGIALERENLVKELCELKKMNKQLLDEKDELVNSAVGTPLNSTDQESSDTSNMEENSPMPSPRNRKRYLKKNSRKQKKSEPKVADKNQQKIEREKMNRVTTSCHPLSRVEEQLTIHSEITEDCLQKGTSSRFPYEEECEVDDEFFTNCPHVVGLPAEEYFSLKNNLNFITPKNHKIESDVICSSNLSNEIHNLESRQISNISGRKSETSVVSTNTQVKRSPLNQGTSNRDKVINNQKEDLSRPSPERLYKIVFIGDSGVGKSSFIHRFCHNVFKQTFSATIGVDFQVKTIEVDSKLVAIQLWDTAGQERFRSLTPQYFRKADGVIIVYDVTSEISFKNVRNWISQVKDGADEQVVIMLIGNKIDLCESDDDRVVKTKHGSRLADEFGTLFFETSAKSGGSVDESIRALTSLLTVKEDENVERALKISEDLKNKKKKCCR